MQHAGILSGGLPQRIQASAQTLALARTRLSEALTLDVGALAWKSFEQSIDACLIEGRAQGTLDQVRRRHRNELKRTPHFALHTLRLGAAVELLGVREQSLVQLRRFAHLDAHGSRLSQVQAARAIEISAEVLQLIGEFFLSVPHRALLESALQLDESSGLIPEHLSGLHRLLVAGRSNSFLGSYLDVLLTRTMVRGQRSDPAVMGELCLLAWRRASQRGQYTGVAGSFYWMHLVEYLRESFHEPIKQIDFLAMKSILMRQFDRDDEASRALSEGYEIGGDDSMLLHRIWMEDAKLHLKHNRPDLAAPIIERGIAAAGERDAADDVLWFEQALGATRAAEGNLGAAEDLLRRGARDADSGNIMLQSVGLHTLVTFYLKLGNWTDAYRTAQQLRRVATPWKLWSQTRLADQVIAQVERGAA